MDELWQRYRAFWTPVLWGVGVFLAGLIVVSTTNAIGLADFGAVQALVPDALHTVASDELFPNEYIAIDRLIVPAPLLVALNAILMAASISVSMSPIILMTSSCVTWPSFLEGRGAAARLGQLARRRSQRPSTRSRRSRTRSARPTTRTRRRRPSRRSTTCATSRRALFARPRKRLSGVKATTRTAIPGECGKGAPLTWPVSGFQSRTVPR